MNHYRLMSVPVALAALFACTSPLSWDAACACAEYWTGVVGDVGVWWADIKEEDVTPQFMADKTYNKLKGRYASLEEVRSLGRSFDSSCIHALSEVRCVFWLWAKGEKDMRGIELRFVSDQNDKIAGVRAHYVYDQRSD